MLELLDGLVHYLIIRKLVSFVCKHFSFYVTALKKCRATFDSLAKLLKCLEALSTNYYNYLRLVFTSDGVAVGVVIRSVELMI